MGEFPAILYRGPLNGQRSDDRMKGSAAIGVIQFSRGKHFDMQAVEINFYQIPVKKTIAQNAVNFFTISTG